MNSEDTTWIALFRGINVGGHHHLPMADLRREIEALGLTGVRTYIQSGNVVFQAPAIDRATLAERVGDSVETHHGFRPRIILLASDELQRAIEANPFPEAIEEPKTLHLAFLAESAKAIDLGALANAKAPSERYALHERVFYLHAPDGIARSKLAGTVDKLLGVATTSRNYRTVAKLAEMAKGR